MFRFKVGHLMPDKWQILVVVLLSLGSLGKAQDSIKLWTTTGNLSFQFSQSNFQNWSSGGVNAVNLSSFFNLSAQYQKDKLTWFNKLEVNYGLSKLQEQEIRKSDDRLELTSKLNSKKTDNWSYSAFTNFRTQFDAGWDYKTTPNTLISAFMAPAYLSVALGMEYNQGKKLTVMVSPVSGKSTFVMNENLSNQGAYGVDSGSVVRHEFGGTVNLVYQNEIMKNVDYKTKLILFSNYLNNPQNIDVNWENLIFLKVNKFITASIIFHLLYDDDILLPLDRDKDGVNESFGKRAQFKEVFGLGFSYKF